MPQSVHQPVLRFSQLDLPVSTTLLTRKEILSDLIVDFRTTTAGERTLQYLLLILMECTGSQYLEYHAHTDEAKFDKALLKASWNLPRLAKLRAFGLFRNSIFPKDQLIGFLPNWKFKKIQRRYECCVNLVRHEFGAVDYRLMQHVQTLPSLKSVMVDCTEFTRS
ncbi:hypothetical protein BGX23_003449 [Mortierella sp. AD031]|nr:hypothetical protein BGX23_003449 [Mortierella sp. AD031]